MGGAKTVSAGKYIKPRDPARDVAVMQMMMQIQKQQQDEQAAMLSKYAQMAPEVQTFDPREISQRAAELGMANLAQQRELEKMTSPEAAAMRLSQSKQVEQLTSPENVRQYMNEYMRTQGLPSQYATGLGDSTIGRAAMYDRALAAKKAYEENLAAQQQAYLAQTEAPVGGLSPAALMAAKQAAQAQNIASGEAYKQAMLGTVGQFGQTGADVANRQFSTLSNLQNAYQQSELGRKQAMIDSAAQNAAAQNAMTGSWIQAGGQVASSAIGAMGGMAGGGGLQSTGGYGSMAGMKQATIPGTTGSYVSGIGYVPRATAI